MQMYRFISNLLGVTEKKFNLRLSQKHPCMQICLLEMFERS